MYNECMNKMCYSCKFWIEGSHNHGSACLGCCYHPLSYNEVTNGDDTCDNWEDMTPKEMREIDTYLKWLKKNEANLSIDYMTQRHMGADVIYTVTHNETNQSLTICRSPNGYCNIIEVNGYDTKTRYMAYRVECLEVYNFVNALQKKNRIDNEDEIQKAIDSFKV